jgi:hypothetical protein
MKIIIVFIFFILPFLTLNAQDKKFQYEISIPYYTKINIWNPKSAPYKLFAENGIQASIKINREEETKPVFLQSIGLANDFTNYKLIENFYFTLNRYVLYTESKIEIPIEKLKGSFLFGLGINYLLSSDGLVGFYNENTSVIYSNATMKNFIDNSIFDNQNKLIIPYITLGYDFQLYNRLRCSFIIKQNALDYMEKNSSLTFFDNSHKKTINISYLPTHFGVRVGYLLRK